MKKKLLRYSTLLILLICSSFKSLQAANEQENALPNQANRVDSWDRKWIREFATQLGFHSICSICVSPIRYSYPKHPNENQKLAYNGVYFYAYSLIHTAYMIDALKATEHKPNTEKDYNKEIGTAMSTDIATGLAGGLINIVVKRYLKKGDTRDICYNFSASCLAGVGLYRLGRLAKKLYIKGYSGLEYEDIAPPPDIIGAVASSWTICKYNKEAEYEHDALYLFYPILYFTLSMSKNTIPYTKMTINIRNRS